MDYNNKEFIERNMAEPKNWKKPFDSDIFDSVFRIISLIFNFMVARFLNTITFVLIILLIYKQWTPAFLLSTLIVPIYFYRFIIRYIAKNHRNMKVSTTSENVTFIKFEKDESLNEGININQPLPPLK
jgi:hypothetical protein